MDRRRALERGFTLVELALVVAIAIALFALAVPRSSDRDRCGAAARAIVADAARARSYAARTWSPVTLDFDPSNSAWRVTRQNGTWLELPGAAAQGWRALDPGLSFEAVGGFDTDAVFLPNGRATSVSQVRLRAGSESWLLTIEAVSGRIVAEPES